jgi:hypothetical protein
MTSRDVFADRSSERIHGALKLISQARGTRLMANFTKGDRGGFQTTDGRMVDGIVTRLNKKTSALSTTQASGRTSCPACCA